ncbi:MAG: hypothetical protein QM500_21710 [Methylococcales bacterium]
MKITKFLIAAGVLAVSSQASAHLLPGGVSLDFSSGSTVTLTDPVGTPGLGASVFPFAGQYYSEKGVFLSAIGFGTSPGFANNVGNFTGGLSHVHSNDPLNNGNLVAELAGDSGGAAYQLSDGHAFSVNGLDIQGLQLNTLFDSMTIRGYTSADLGSWYDVMLSNDVNGNAVVMDGSTAVATQTGTDALTGQVFRGTHVHLDDVAAFGDLYLFEYFYNRNNGDSFRGLNPNQGALSFRIDNLEVSAPVSAVPVPAAAYLFASAMIGLVGVGRKRKITELA